MPGMSELQLNIIRDFTSTRDTLVAELEKFSGGDTNGRVVVRVQSFLFRIKNTLAMWARLRWNLKNEGRCFEDRCINLMVLADEMAQDFPHCVTTVIDEKGVIEIQDLVMRKSFDMLAMQLGSLTLWGCSNIDTAAVENACMAEKEQRRWEQKPVSEDDECSKSLRNMWFRMYYKDMDCDCHQCLDLYLPLRSPTPSPTLPRCPCPTLMAIPCPACWRNYQT
ncbi:hypothetical protein N7516_008710 [Penicillium verrucosum]|uniref:uncharacterized protein n=1 Tax=Penicillium verrucosum TaxID=60171 RepID=UPI002545034D|nr:uncharacterized protein N7516_008710 [Penicillium verrucosum]KAJ5926937.1 hypothetical protein N7516_008710 [Penicillium verrucosum]